MLSSFVDEIRSRVFSQNLVDDKEGGNRRELGTMMYQ